MQLKPPFRDVQRRIGRQLKAPWVRMMPRARQRTCVDDVAMTGEDLHHHRRVVVPNPDVKGRLGILKVHSRKTPLGEDVDLDTLVGGSGGGVLNTEGQLVGVHTNGDCGEQGGYNAGWTAEEIVRVSPLLADSVFALP